MLRKKPQLSDTIKIITITSSSWGGGRVVGTGGGVAVKLRPPLGRELRVMVLIFGLTDS